MYAGIDCFRKCSREPNGELSREPIVPENRSFQRTDRSKEPRVAEEPRIPENRAFPRTERSAVNVPENVPEYVPEDRPVRTVKLNHTHRLCIASQQAQRVNDCCKRQPHPLTLQRNQQVQRLLKRAVTSKDLQTVCVFHTLHLYLLLQSLRLLTSVARSVGVAALLQQSLTRCVC